jgi:integrase/recombinase XerD
MNTDFNKNNVLEYEKYLINIKRYSDNTVKSYISSICKFFNYFGKDSSRIYISDIHDYIEYLVMQGLSFSNQNIFISSIILYFKKFHPERRFVNKLERPAKSEQIPDILSKNEVNILIDSYDNIKHKALIAFIYCHGLRRSEAKNFKLSDFDKSNGSIKVKQSKGRKDRIIGLNLKCRQILIQYFNEYHPNEYLFNGQKSNQYSVESMAKVLKSGLKKCKIHKSITLHSLRHSFATHLYNQGIDLDKIQLILGHKSTNTTKLYAKLSDENIINIQVA